MFHFYKYKFIPQNYLAEEILIGIILIYPTIIKKTKNLITPNIFFIENNKFIYSKFLNEANPNFITLLDEIKCNQVLGMENYFYYMIKIMKKSQAFISYYNANNYIESIIKILKRTYIKRLFIQLGYNIIKLGYSKDFDSNNSYNKLIKYTNNIEKEIQNEKSNNINSIKEFISHRLIGVRSKNTLTNSRFRDQKIQSGLINLDKIIHHLPKGNLVIIAGRPSIGKTSFSINIAYNCFIKNNVNLLIFSLEMTSNQIFNKFISIGSKIQLEKKVIKTINNIKWQKISRVCNKLLKQNIYINEKPNLNIKQIELIARELKQNQFIELVIIDYLQLIEVLSIQKTNGTRNQEIGYITRRLKLLAQYLKIPIIAISQLNRNIENRTNKEPLLSDLKESGCVSIKNNINKPIISEHKLSIKSFDLIKKKPNTFCLRIKKDLVSILNKNIFRCNMKSREIYLTNNHKISYKTFWITLHQMSKSIQTIENIATSNKYDFNIKKYLKIMNFCYLYKTYDIHINNYFNFRVNHIQTHNSIEQDADIIMILYETKNQEDNINSKEHKFIDLKVSKNRNGQTGYCKLKFELYNNEFKDI